MFRKLNNYGSALMLTIVLGTLSLFIVLGLVSFAVNESKATRYKARREQAMQIAEAGIAYYRWHLAHNKEDFKDGKTEPGPYVHEYRDKNGDVIGYYSLDIIPPTNGSTIVTIYSTGWTTDQPDSKRTLKVRLGFPALSDYAFLVESDLVFSASAFVHGKTHANGRIVFNGMTDAPISSALEIIGTGGPRSYWLFPVPSKELSSVAVKLQEIKTETQANGIAWPYLPPSGAYGYQLAFRNDGTVDVSKVNSSPVCYSDYCYDATDFGPVTNYEIPSSSYIFVDDRFWVKGDIKGRVTAATIGNDIIINGNVTYVAKDGTNVLGLMTDSNIVFPYDVPDPMEVDAALATVNGTIFRPKYEDQGAGSKHLVNVQNFYGSRISNFSGAMKYSGCGSYCSGFVNTNYTYDANLTYQPPAGFPVGSSYNMISWEEVRTTTEDTFIPVGSITISPSSATVPTYGTQQFTAAVMPVNATIKNISWSVLGGDQNGRISANGLYTAPDINPGPVTIIASSGGVVSLATVTVTSSGNSPPTIQIQPSANPASTASKTTNLSVLGRDDAGEANLTYTWATVSKPTGASNPTFSFNGSNTAKNTTVTFYMAGTYQFQVTIRDGNGLFVNSSLLSVGVTQTLTGISVTPSPALLAIDTTLQFSATQYDQFGFVMADPAAVSWSADSGSIIDGLFTPAVTGSTTVHAVSGSISGSSDAIVTDPAAAPTVAISVPAVYMDNSTSNPTTGYFNVGASQMILAFVGANRINGSVVYPTNFTVGTYGTPTGGSITWSLVGFNNTSNGAVGIFKGIPTASLTNVRVRFTSGSSRYEFLKVLVLSGASPTINTPTRNNGTSAPNITLTATAAKSLIFAAGYDYSYPGGTPTFDQTVVDSHTFTANFEGWVQQSNVPTSNPGNVSFNRSSPATGGWNMIAIEVKTAGPGTQAPTIVTPASASPSNVYGTTSTLSVLGDDDGSEANLTYTWSVVSQPSGVADPDFSVANNTNAAKNNLITFYGAGTYALQVTIRDTSGNTVTSPQVTVTVNRVLTGISIIPNSIDLAAGGSPMLFSVTSTDQFGNGMSPAPTFTWSVNNGTVSQAGLYTPPASVGTALLNAASGSVTGTSAITVSQTGGSGPNCTSGACITQCGDGIVSLGEECDDNNLVSGDGCSSTCTWENIPGVTCSNIASDLPQTLNVPIVLRDVKGYYEPGHPDFERYMCSVASRGLVQNQLTNGKPVFARSTPYPSNGCGTQLTSSTPFAQWYVDTPGVNKTISEFLTLKLIGTSPATYEYNSITDPRGNTQSTIPGFFPLDSIPTPASWGITPSTGYNHNYHFTTEMHYWFTYEGGEVLSFSGDDDVWVFINGKLALDLGGLHPRVDGSVTLNSTVAAQLGLEVGGAYEIALFHAERHTTESNFRLTLGGFEKSTTHCSSSCGDGVTALGFEQCDLGVNTAAPDYNGKPGGACTADCHWTGQGQL